MPSRLVSALLCALIASLAPAARADFIDLWANKLDMPLNKAPRLGKSKVLLIPVEIAYGQNPPIDRAALTSFFTGANDGSFNFNGFYARASNGRYQAAITVAPTVKYNGCPAMLASTPGCTIGRSDVTALKAGMDFVRDVFRRTHDENGVDFSQFDVNGLNGEPDGTIDGVMMIVNVADVGLAFPIEYVNSGSNLNGGTGGAFVIDGIRVPYVAIGGTSLVGNQPRFELVVLHEFGHMLGLADLYYEHPMMGDQYPNWQGLHFSLMGDYSYDERATMPDAESRRALGWMDMHVVNGQERLTLLPSAAGGFAVKLGQMNGARKEYFLVENRGPVGPFDLTTDSSGKPMWGLSVMHVDWSLGPKAEQGAWTERLLSCLDCDPFHPFIRNLESSGTWGLVFTGPVRRSLTGQISGETDDRVLFTQGKLAVIPNAGPLTTNNRYIATNWYDGTDSGIAIEDIVVNPDHSITATFTAPTFADVCSDVRCAPNEQCAQAGEHAGNCTAIVAPTPVLPDAGTPAAPPNIPQPLSSGCSTGAPGALAIAGLLLAAFAFRRRRS